MEKKLFDCDIIGKVKVYSPPGDRISEQNLDSKFCNFFVHKITNISNILKDCSSLVLDEEKEPRMIELSQVSKSYVEKMIGESKATTVEQTQYYLNS